MRTLAPLLHRRSVLFRRKPGCSEFSGPVYQSPAVSRLLGRSPVQAKLVVGPSGDRFEQEADRVAAALMSDGVVPRISSTVPGTTQPMCDACEGEMLSAKGDGAVPLGDIDERAVAKNRQGGKSLPETSKRRFESALGRDFGSVRVHDDRDADRSARRLGARAYTVGEDLIFRSGQYAPETERGGFLLAHELVHVVQQSGGGRETIRRDEDPVVFPDFPRLLPRLESDLAENVYNNAHHFFRIHSLYPDRPDLHEQVFSRFALGANVLSTGFQFAGFSPEVADVLAPVTGILYKGVNFATEGELVLDYQIQMADGVYLEGNLDLMVNPDDVSQVRRVNVGLGVVGHF